MKAIVTFETSKETTSQKKKIYHCRFKCHSIFMCCLITLP